jgi:hypothetical protein
VASATDPRISTVRGGPPAVQDGPTPTEETLPDGQKADHWVLSEEERAKGFIRPVRRSYRHVGIPGPRYPLRDLTPEERERYSGCDFAKFEAYPEGEQGSVTGRFWTQADLDRIGKGCGTVTSMPVACAETYAVNPSFYGSTFCCGCRGYHPVGERGEFVWDDAPAERVGA